MAAAVAVVDMQGRPCDLVLADCARAALLSQQFIDGREVQPIKLEQSGLSRTHFPLDAGRLIALHAVVRSREPKQVAMQAWRGRNVGGRAVPGCDCSGQVCDCPLSYRGISRPTLADIALPGALNASPASGIARRSVSVPARLSGEVVWFAGASRSRCRLVQAVSFAAIPRFSEITKLHGRPRLSRPPRSSCGR